MEDRDRARLPGELQPPRLPGGEAATVVNADARSWLPTQPRGGFDVAFVDPPFAAGLWDLVLPSLLPLMADGGWIYVEAPVGGAISPAAPWHLHREGSTRDVHYALYRHRPAPATSPGAAVATLAPDLNERREVTNGASE